MTDETLDAQGSQCDGKQNFVEEPPRPPPPFDSDSSADFVSQALPYWCAWPSLRRPLYLVRTNRDIVPELPPETPMDAVRCVNGRRGLLEASRLPQRFDEDKWYMAFVPLAKPRNSEVPFEVGRPWWHIEYTDASEDLGWYRLVDEHIQSVGNELFKPYWQLRNRIETTEIQTSHDWRAYLSKARERLPVFVPPHASYDQFVQLSQVLCCQSLAKWDLLAYFADWQRSLNEVRGWLSFVHATANSEWSRGQPHLQPDVAAQYAKYHVATRHVAPYRGVFVHDERTALCKLRNSREVV